MNDSTSSAPQSGDREPTPPQMGTPFFRARGLEVQALALLLVVGCAPIVIEQETDRTSNEGGGGASVDPATTTSVSTTASVTPTSPGFPLQSCSDWSVATTLVSEGYWTFDDAAAFGQNDLAVAYRLYDASNASPQAVILNAAGQVSNPISLGSVQTFPMRISAMGTNGGVAFHYVAGDFGAWEGHLSSLVGGTLTNAMVGEPGYPEGIMASGNGFSALLYSPAAAYDPPQVATILPNGTVSSKTLLPEWVATSLTPHPQIPMTSGGSLLLGSTDAIECSDCPLHAVAARLNGNGEQTGSLNPVFEHLTFGIGSWGAHVSLTPVQGGAWVAWVTENSDPEGSHLIHTVQLDDSGAVVLSAVANHLEEGIPGQVDALSMTTLADGSVAVAWVERGADESHLRMRLLDENGTFVQTPIEVDTLVFYKGTQLRVNPSQGGANVTVSGVRGGVKGIYNYKVSCIGQ